MFEGAKTHDAVVGKYTPVFTRDGNRLVITLPGFLAVGAPEADEIGRSTRILEGIIFNLKYNGETLRIPPKINHVYGKISAGRAMLPVAVLSGPLYDRYAGDTAVVGDHP